MSETHHIISCSNPTKSFQAHSKIIHSLQHHKSCQLSI
jgi:hypothetical protein